MKGTVLIHFSQLDKASPDTPKWNGLHQALRNTCWVHFSKTSFWGNILFSPSERWWSLLTQELRPEKVFPKMCLPKFWAKFGWTFWVNSYKNPSFCEYQVRIAQKILGKTSDDSLLLRDSFGPQRVSLEVSFPFPNATCFPIATRGREKPASKLWRQCLTLPARNFPSSHVCLKWCFQTLSCEFSCSSFPSPLFFIRSFFFLSLSLYIYICCEVIIWAKFGHFRCYYLGQVGVIIWANLFLAYKNSGFKRFLHTQLSFSFFCAQLSGSYLKIAFFKKWVQKLGFSNFCVLS